MHQHIRLQMMWKPLHHMLFHFQESKEASHPPSKELEEADYSRERCGGGGHSSPANNPSPSCLSPSSSISSIHRDALLPFPVACQKDNFLIAFCYNTQQAEILQCEKHTDEYIQYITHANCTDRYTIYMEENLVKYETCDNWQLTALPMESPY